MMASTHITLGLAGWVAYANLQGIPIQPLPLVVAGVASLLPDIDHPKSSFGRVVPFISIPMSLIFGHRGVTHSLIAIIATVAAGWIYSGAGWFVLPLVIGYLSHLIGDVFTNSGAPLLWPRKDKISFPIFNTGSIFESWFRLALGLFTLWMIWNHLKWTLHIQN